MELAVVDSNPAIVEIFKNIGVALAKADIGMIVRFAGMDGLRRNNVIARYDDHKRNAGRLEIIGVEVEELTLFVEDMIERPAQGERRVLVLQQGKLVEAPDRLPFLGGRIPE